jgi:hypothetical protein
MRMSVIRVATWNELNEALYENSYQPEIHRFRSTYAFRGMGKSEFPLDTSLTRIGEHFEKMERHLLRNFRKYAHRSVVDRDSVWYWLTVGQHHGLPTRLLDWTFSPDVALHFATCDTDHFRFDGAVWCVNFREAHQLLPQSLKDPLRDEGSDVYTVEMLNNIAPTFEAFQQMAAEDLLVFFEPPSLDDRIINQFALHSVMSRSVASLSGWLAKHPECWRKIEIPARLKQEIRDKLDQANITERVLFPGLDGLTAWLKRQYSQIP